MMKLLNYILLFKKTILLLKMTEFKTAPYY